MSRCSSMPVMMMGASVHQFPSAHLGKSADLPKYPPVEYRMAAKGTKAEIVLYGVIGSPYDGITSKQFIADLKKLGDVKTMDILINSPGGYVTDGVAIANRLRAHPATKNVFVDGEASSIASYIAMVGDQVTMGVDSMMLVHRPWSLALGNEDDFARALKDLQLVQASIVDTYAKRTGMKSAEVLSLMKEDRYMSAAEAVTLGFADKADGMSKMAALAVDRGALHLPNLPAGARPNRTRAAAAVAAMVR